MAAVEFGKRGLETKATHVKFVELENEKLPKTKAQRDQRLRKIAYWLFGVAGALFVAAALLRSAGQGDAVAKMQPMPTREGWSVVSADKISVYRPSEPQATYTVIGVARTADGKAIAANTRYSPNTGWNYTLRAYACDTGKLLTLGSGDTFEEMQIYRPEPSWGQLVEGSSATQVAEIACAKIGKKLVGVR